jgi:hypothetical protein
VYVPGEVDLSAAKNCIASNDDWRDVKVNRYEVRDVTLPDWLSPDVWLRHWVEFKFLWESGADKSWSESWTRGLLALDTNTRHVAVKLLNTKKFRSDFRAAMHKRLVEWLETPSESRAYKSPFSARMFDCLFDTHTARDAKRTSENNYWNKNSLGVVNTLVANPA